MAPRTPNGNPRRCWIVFDHQGNRIDCVDEGNVGAQAFTHKYPGGTALVWINVKVREYRDALNDTLAR
jgi:hypothetical protein